MIRRPTNSPRHALEEAFCRDVDNMLIGRLQTQADSEEAKARLSKATGLNDEKLINQLASLGVTPAGLMAVQMVPLVLIAWADHGVDDKERRLVMKRAKRFGVSERSEASALLDHWLDHRPPPLLLDTWKRFIRHELSSMPTKSRRKLVEMTQEQIRAVARCSGGFFGFGSISANEQKLIRVIHKVLNDCLSEADANRVAG